MSNPTTNPLLFSFAQSDGGADVEFMVPAQTTFQVTVPSETVAVTVLTPALTVAYSRMDFGPINRGDDVFVVLGQTQTVRVRKNLVNDMLNPYGFYVGLLLGLVSGAGYLLAHLTRNVWEEAG